MHEVILLRAYGDFVIILQALINSESKSYYKLVASLHLKPIYEAISETTSLNELNIEFVDFKIKGSLLNLFTNRKFFNLNTLKQIFAIKKYLNSKFSIESNIYLENKNRSKLFKFLFKKNIKTIVNSGQVYSEMNIFFNSKFPLINIKISKIFKVLILPDARLKKRNIPQKNIDQIIDEANKKNLKTTVAYFKNQLNGTTNYDNFNDLIKLIRESDYIISSDSLPMHLANFYSKPHFVVYPSGGLKDFFTPHVLKNKFHGEFDSISTYFPSYHD
jgi:hypothetical protein